ADVRCSAAPPCGVKDGRVTEEASGCDPKNASKPAPPGRVEPHDRAICFRIPPLSLSGRIQHATVHRLGRLDDSLAGDCRRAADTGAHAAITGTATANSG